VAGFSGDAGDALREADPPRRSSNGMMFSTSDNDNSLKPDGGCSEMYHVGWWYNWCSATTLNVHGFGIWTTGRALNDVTASHMLLKLN